MRRIINLKQIPSAVLDRAPDVKQLGAMEFGTPTVHRALSGRGEIRLLSGAPQYLAEANPCGVEAAFYVDIELEINGGRVLHDYVKR